VWACSKDQREEVDTCGKVEENFVEGYLWKVGVLWTNWRCKVGETWMGGIF
jgi:hypothetical protein